MLLDSALPTFCCRSATSPFCSQAARPTDLVHPLDGPHMADFCPRGRHDRAPDVKFYEEGRSSGLLLREMARCHFRGLACALAARVSG